MPKKPPPKTTAQQAINFDAPPIVSPQPSKTPQTPKAPIPSASPTVPASPAPPGARHTVPLLGCTPEPLSHYLKALAIFRLISEQKDPTARAYWKDDAFVLSSKLDAAQLVHFFLHEYKPSPILSPWNGGGGFYPKDSKEGFNAILNSTAPRFAPYKTAIITAQNILKSLGYTETRPDSGDGKNKVLIACRARLPDDALEWLDAAFILTTHDGDTQAAPPPLLGTGGNDGRLEFSNNQMQRLALTLFNPATGAPNSHTSSQLQSALFATTSDVMTRDAIGQFFPSASGGANATDGFDGLAVVNPWDFVLMLEGAVMFTAAAVRRMGVESMPTRCAPPFTVRTVNAGHGHAAAGDEARAEIWLPLWNNAVSLPELRALLSEGRVRLSNRPVQDAVEFARAAVSLGVDRGIHAFSRIGLIERNGLAYFGIPLGRFLVTENSGYAKLLEPIHEWLARFQRAAKDDLTPNSVKRAAQQLQDSILNLCRNTNDPKACVELWLALGRCSRALARSTKWVAGLKSPLSPLTLNDPAWFEAAQKYVGEQDQTQATFFRLAAALASIGIRPRKEKTDKTDKIDKRDKPPLLMRAHLEPVEFVEPTQKNAYSRSNGWWETPKDTASHDNNVVWHDGELHRALCAVMQRRVILGQQSSDAAFADHGLAWAFLSDICALIEDRVDERRFRDWLWACALSTPNAHRAAFESAHALRRAHIQQLDSYAPDALYSLLRLCFTEKTLTPDQNKIPVVPHIFKLAAAGDSPSASQWALRRLHASGLTPRLRADQPLFLTPSLTKRIAAALLIPITKHQYKSLYTQVLVVAKDEDKSTSSD